VHLNYEVLAQKPDGIPSGKLIFPSDMSSGRMRHPALFPGCQDFIGPIPSVFRDKRGKYKV